MFAPSRTLRAAAQLLKPTATLPPSSSPASSTATLKSPARRQATAPSTPEQWRRVAKHRPPPAAPVLPHSNPLRLPKPPFVQIRGSPAQTTSARLVREGQFDEGAEENAKAEMTLSPEGKARMSAQNLARRVCETAVTELLVDTYPKLSPEALTGVRTLLLSDSSLALIARHYKLGADLPASKVPTGGQPGAAGSASEAAALLRAYLAALHAQEGERFAYQWIRQCLRSVLNTDYNKLREQQKDQARAARDKEILSPLSHLRNFVRHRPGLEAVWNVAVKGEREEYRAEVALLGLRAMGTAKTIRMAKQNAAEKLMELVWRAASPEDLDSDLPDYPKLLVLWASQSERRKPQFDCQTEKAPVVRCTLEVEGQRFVERALSKRAARFLAAKSAVSTLEIDLASVRVQPLRRPSQVRRREKFQELLAERAKAARSGEATAAATTTHGNEAAADAILEGETTQDADARNSRSSSVNADSLAVPSTHGRSQGGSTDPAALDLSLGHDTQAVPGPGPLVLVPLTPPPAFNASFAQMQKTRLAAASRSPLGLREAPKTLNEGEKDRLQGLLRVESVRMRRPDRPNERGRRQGEKLVTRIKVWARHDGLVALLAFVWVILQLSVFGIGVVKYEFSPRTVFGPTFVIARSAALVLHVDIALILLPVCRSFVTLMRNSPLKRIVPFDEANEFHKLAAWSIVFFSLVHTIAHVVNSWLLGHSMSTTTMGSLGHAVLCNFSTGPFLTGWLMLVLLACMAFFAAGRRRRAHFERFYYTHLLYLPFFALWQLHGMFCMIKPDSPPYCSWKQIGVFWFYWSFGGAVYITERLLREVRSRHRTFISKVIHHPNKVVELQIKKEKTRRMRPGQYIMINCPAVSYWQWHPFTLTNAPAEDLSVHIRVVGDWTRGFALAVGCDPELNEASSKDLDGEGAKGRLHRVLPRIMVDGPFGTASEGVFQAEVAVLIGAGIGVTPFASILKHIWYCARDDNPSSPPLKLRKVYFFWICRETTSFEWFQSLLQAIEEQDSENFIEIYTFMTGLLENRQVENIYTNDVGTDRDAVTGLRAPTHYGRPNWDRVFSSIASAHPATNVGVYFCGPPALSSTLHKMCLKHTSGKPGSARFSYSKERF
ncbi:hypothetical protein JCM3774_006038 [Rhodotorula dairenensis]